MILVLCFDDGALVQAARAAQRAAPGVFGAVVPGFTNVPRLMAAENLFITAHGAMDGDDGNPVIGDANGAHWWNAPQLVESLESIFPNGYSGSVYISACESSDNAEGSFSFAEAFRNTLAPSHDVRVYGQRGGVGLTIPLPTARGWVQATV